MERVLRQLQEIDGKLDHFSIETMIKSRLPPWILNKVYRMKSQDDSWSESKLRRFLIELVQRNEE